MWIAKPVYSTLPTMYLLGGAAAIVYSGNILGVSFGVLLALIAIVIWRMRKEAKTQSDAYRQQNTASPLRRRR